MKRLLALWFVAIVGAKCELVADKECASRFIPGKSSICVCNSTYCDTITRINPKPGVYVTYTSSEAGLRFKKATGSFLCNTASIPDIRTLTLYPSTLYQEISGFGSPATDSAGINWLSLSDEVLRKYLVNSYFGETGLEYNMIRLPIGGTDFSTRLYTYQDTPKNDPTLSNFTLAPEDINLKIPLIKECMAVSTSPIWIVGSLWSPPIWMKTSNEYRSGYLKAEYYQSLADYFYQFLEKYAENGIPIWGITTTNEPVNYIMTPTYLNRLQWTVYNMSDWIVNNLGPTIRNSKFKDVKIIGVDDQRFTIPLWFSLLHSSAKEYLDGIAVHFYADVYSPPEQLTLPLKDYPDKFVISTEASDGNHASADKKVDLGSWDRAERYITDIIEDLNYQVIGWIDWNMCLNHTGGPALSNENLVDSPIIVSEDHSEFYKQPMYYAMGHFSKFIPRGSKRIKVEENNCCYSKSIQYVAFLTPSKTMVVVLFNKGNKTKVAVKLDSRYAVLNLEAKSITTVEFSC